MTAAIPRLDTEAFAPWQPATWADYERYRDDATLRDRVRLFFHYQI
jgi:hypothetical protein